MEQVATTLLSWGVPGLLILLLVLLLAYLVSHPDVTYKWAEILAVAASKVNRRFDRRAVRIGLQRELQAFARDLAAQTGRAAPHPVELKWTSAAEPPQHFHADGRLVIRLHDHERQDRNLVNASMLVVSQQLARRAKRFLAPKQARSTDLYAVDRLLRRSPDALDLFREEIFGPEVDADQGLRELIESFQAMDRAQLFFPVYVRELNHLGQEVVVPPRDERLIVDVDHLVAFLVQFAGRTIGQESDRTLQGNVLRCALFIVARRDRRESGLIGQPVEVLRGFVSQGIKTIYVIGAATTENRAFLDKVVGAFMATGGWRLTDSRQYTTILNLVDGTEAASRTQMLVLRYPGEHPEEDDDATGNSFP